MRSLRLLALLFAALLFSVPAPEAAAQTTVTWERLGQVRLGTQNGRSVPMFASGVRRLNGQTVRIRGYMIPLEYKPKSDDIVIFMLVRDLMSCCFGGMPRPDEWVYVEMRGDAVARLFPYVPVVVRGELIVGRLEDEFGFATGVYTMKGDSVEAFEPGGAAGSGVKPLDQRDG